MCDIYCYSYVEDAPSAAILRRLVEERNAHHPRQLKFMEGFPVLTHGYRKLKEKAPSLLNMAKGGIHTLCLTDLDTSACAVALIRDWFAFPTEVGVALPREVTFRVAVREVEAWVLADRHAWARYIGIGAANFAAAPETLRDPKQHLLSTVRRKGRRAVHKEMLPRGSASIGPRYNEILCNFIASTWLASRAAAHAPSLRRAVDALARL